jgi:large subunit ribosomal protein L30
MAKTFKVKLIKGLAGSTQSQRDSIRCLGLRRKNQERIVKDSPAMRGIIYTVHHMLEVSVEK